MTILHVVRDPNERLALEVAGHECKHDRVSLLLIQDAVLARPLLPGGTVYALTEDLEARGVKYQGPQVDYDGAVRLMIDHNKVVVW